MKIAFLLSVVFLFGSLFANTDPLPTIDALTRGEVFLIDVREPEETSSGTIKGARLLPLSAIQEDPAKATDEVKRLAKGRSIYLFCRSGNRSGKVKDILQKHGQKAYNIGGYEELLKKGFPKFTR